MVLKTDAIDARGMIDPRYTCDTDNSSPELRWDAPPPETGGFALLVQDLDYEVQRPGEFAAAPACHWVIYAIPPTIRHLPAGIPPQDVLPNGIRQGVNSFGKLGYTGPCPPMRGGDHRYRFTLLALREGADMNLPPRTTREQLLARIQPFILEAAEVTGRYQRAARKAG